MPLKWHEIKDESEWAIEISKGLVQVDRELLPEEAKQRHTRLLEKLAQLMRRIQGHMEACDACAKRIQRGFRRHLGWRTQAVTMALHPRLGENSALACLPPDLLRQCILTR
jgi:hypothetical protein